MVKITEINTAAVAAAAQLYTAADGPVYMVNLLRYREYADYGNAAGIAPCSGREVYFYRYVRAFNEIAEGEGVKIFFLGKACKALAAPDGEEWDDIAIVEYPDMASFRRITESAEYQAAAAPHRRAALEDWRLFATGRITL